VTPAIGFVLVDKPTGWTSHDVVGRLRRLVGTKKVGHAGTLDPLATGLLICGVGRATRLLSHVMGEDKVYAARLRFGVETDTEDAAGEVVAAAGAAGLSLADVTAAGERFLGPIEQTPSAVSAIKVDGKRSYALVRAGETPKLEARRVVIRRLEFGEAVASILPASGAPQDRHPATPPDREDEAVASIPPASDALQLGRGDAEDRHPATHPDRGGDAVASHIPASDALPGATPVLDVDLIVECSAGTYIRALARDLGHAVGAGAHLIGLRRLRSGSFAVEEAGVGLAELEAGSPVAPVSVTSVMERILSRLDVDESDAWRVASGQALDRPLAAPTLVVGPDGAALAVYAPSGGRAVPQVVLVAGGQGLQERGAA
jgi:tRNA pseudouridine55 synthase